MKQFLDQFIKEGAKSLLSKYISSSIPPNIGTTIATTKKGETNYKMNRGENTCQILWLESLKE